MIVKAIPVYEVDGKVSTNEWMSPLYLTPHWNRPDLIEIKVGDGSFTVKARELKEAIERMIPMQATP